MKSWSTRSKIILATAYWRGVKNFRRTWDHRFDEPVSTPPLVNRFRTEGLLTGMAEHLFGQTGRFAAVRLAMQNILLSKQVQDAMAKAGQEKATKDFVISVLPNQFEVQDPYVQLAIDPELLNLVNGYLGLRAYLRAIVGWINVPTPGQPSDTQLWHQDQDDLHQVKAFFYCNDVDLSTGPFCFIPGTHRWGNIDTKDWFANPSGRLTDAAMATRIPESQWFVGTGRAGTVILADTTGCHKGLKPLTGHRLLVMLHYTSGAPLYPRSFSLLGDLPANLTNVQRAALTPPSAC